MSEESTLIALLRDDPVDWMEHYFFIEDSRDPFTGEIFGPGTIRLHPLQQRILRAALIKTDNIFDYSTVLYSTIKKSGKTRVAAGVAMWYAATQGPYNEVYCMANDGKQSADRILSAVKKCLDLNPAFGDWKQTKTSVVVPNGTIIEAIPCDPTGSAGAAPGLTVWSEMWGFDSIHKERLWAEMTIPPTKFGRALRWVESYAGYTGESTVLEELYDLGVKHSRRHPAFPDLPVYTHSPARQFTYWDDGDAARRMPWQTPDYYIEEATHLTPSEFSRLHKNEWVNPVAKAIPIEWWDRLKRKIPPLDASTPVVVAVDAGIAHDCSAAIIVSRHPDPNLHDEYVMVRDLRLWEPPPGGKIDFDETIEPTIKEWADRYNVVEVVFDKYQLHGIMTRTRKSGINTYDFSQQGLRSVSDRKLYNMIVTGKVSHNGNTDLRTHVDNASIDQGGGKFRFVKPSQPSKKSHLQNATSKPIDLLVALSMGSYRCLYLIL